MLSMRERVLGEVVDILEREPAQRIGDGEQIALDVIGRGGDVPVRRRIRAVARDRSGSCVRARRPRCSPACSSGSVARGSRGVGAAGIVVGVVGVGLPGGRLEDVRGWSDRRGDRAGHAIDDALLRSVRIDRADDQPARVVNIVAFCAKLRAGRRRVVPAGGEERLVFLDNLCPCCRRSASR